MLTFNLPWTIHYDRIILLVVHVGSPDGRHFRLEITEYHLCRVKVEIHCMEFITATNRKNMTKMLLM